VGKVANAFAHTSCSTIAVAHYSVTMLADTVRAVPLELAITFLKTKNLEIIRIFEVLTLF
jgi:hypothetical protein